MRVFICSGNGWPLGDPAARLHRPVAHLSLDPETCPHVTAVAFAAGLRWISEAGAQADRRPPAAAVTSAVTGGRLAAPVPPGVVASRDGTTSVGHRGHCCDTGGAQRPLLPGKEQHRRGTDAPDVGFP